MKLKYIPFLIAILTLSNITSVTAAERSPVRFSLIGGVNDMLGPSPGGFGYTAGLDIDIRLGSRLGFFVGGEYLSRKIANSSNYNYVHIPVGLTFHLISILAINAGGFYDAGLKSIATPNYGIMAALRIFLGRSHLFLEGRYNYGLDSKAWGSNTSEVEALFGIMF